MKKVSILFLLITVFITLPLYSQELGDVNNDSDINIVDALLIAQYSVGLDPRNFNVNTADVNGNGEINIVDALLVAQYYVGLIDSFPGSTSSTTTSNSESTPPPVTTNCVGNVYMSPSFLRGDSLHTRDRPLDFDLLVNTGTRRLATYCFDIYYPSQYIGIAYVNEGDDGFIYSITTAEEGVVKVSGHVPGGIKPGSDIHLLACSMYLWYSQGGGTIDIDVKQLTDENGDIIGFPNSTGGYIIYNHGTSTSTSTTTTSTCGNIDELVMTSTTTTVSGYAELPWHETFDNEPGGNFFVSGETRTWTSETINISLVDRALISVEIEGINIGETGDSNYVNLYYSLDGGNPELWGIVDQSTSGTAIFYLSGNTLVVSLEARTNSSSEIFIINNINVTGSANPTGDGSYSTTTSVSPISTTTIPPTTTSAR